MSNAENVEVVTRRYGRLPPLRVSVDRMYLASELKSRSERAKSVGLRPGEDNVAEQFWFQIATQGQGQKEGFDFPKSTEGIGTLHTVLIFSRKNKNKSR